MFRHNVGGIDRVLRVTLGGILFLGGLLLLTGTTKLGVTLTVVGLLALLTGVVGFCALYIPFGISTARVGGRPLNQVLRLRSLDEDNARQPYRRRSTGLSEGGSRAEALTAAGGG